jgi:hypothetical protein
MSSPTPRASLLAGLRTGGVRSSSSKPPLTASLSSSSSFSFTPSTQDNHLSKSLTAAVDGPSNSFSLQQQSSAMNPNSIPFSPAAALPNNFQAQAQALQFQMMQLEILRLQNLQAQKYQADLLAEAHRQQLSQIRRPSPATAGPTNPSFDIRPPTQIRRTLDSSKPSSSHLPVANDDKLPMSAALGGKFGSRTPSSSLASSLRFVSATADSDDPSSTTVISGGTALGTPTLPTVSTPSKSDAATSWRRGGNNNSVLSGNNRSPSVKVTPPPPSTDRTSPPIADRNSPPLPTHVTKARPVPLRFSPAVSQPLPVVAVEGSPTDRVDDGYSTSSSSRSLSSPTTPRSASSSGDLPLSPREEATKKLYEGLGIGRPTMVVVDPPAAAAAHPLTVVGHRLASQPMRQPRGPPSGTDELGPQNFATRLRRKAIGGLGAALLSARERREVVEAY